MGRIFDAICWPFELVGRALDAIPDDHPAQA